MSALKSKTWLSALLLAWHVAVAPAAEIPEAASPTPVVLGDPPVAPLVSTAPRGPYSAAAVAPPGLAIDTQNREAVRLFYRSVYFQSEDVPMAWTGSYATGDPGTTAQTFRDSVALRLNWYRAMAGVPAFITLLDQYNVKDQQAALMMSANGQLSHAPPSTWLYYTAAGAEAAGSSNLTLGSMGGRAVTEYIRDVGGNNVPVGHRRWLLYPQTENMGTGDVPGGPLNGATALPANAIWVFDGRAGAARPATRDGFVAWPPKGYVPYTVVFGRWSLSYPNADFGAATVTVSKGGNAIPVTVEHRSNAMSPNYGEDTIVWLLTGFNDSSTQPRPSADETYAVTVSGVQGAGVPTSFSYDVSVFDPDVVTPGAPLTTAVAPATVSAGTPFAASVIAMPGATAYQLALHRTSTLGGALTPGNSAASWTQLTSGYDALEATEFHLYHAAFASQQLTLNKSLFAGQNASVSFTRRFGFATTTEVARVQVSLDGGASWQDVHTEAGTGSTVASAPVTVSLAAFAGRMLRLRFGFTAAGSFYPCNTCGWYFQNVAFNNVSELTLAGHEVELLPPQLGTNLVAADTGNHVLLARTEYQGSYFSDWGPGAAIVATVEALGAPTAVSASTGYASAIVTFTAPAFDGGSPIAGYTATCTSSNGGVPGSGTAGGGATAIGVGGLTIGKTYTCTVTASNSGGTGPTSAPSNAVRPFDLASVLFLLLAE